MKHLQDRKSNHTMPLGLICKSSMFIIKIMTQYWSNQNSALAVLGGRGGDRK